MVKDPNDLADNTEEKTIDEIKEKLGEGFNANIDPSSKDFTHHQEKPASN